MSCVPVAGKREKKGEGGEQVEAGTLALLWRQGLTNDGHHVRQHVSFGHLIQTGLEGKADCELSDAEEERSSSTEVSLHQLLAWS